MIKLKNTKIRLLKFSGTVFNLRKVVFFAFLGFQSAHLSPSATRAHPGCKKRLFLSVKNCHFFREQKALNANTVSLHACFLFLKTVPPWERSRYSPGSSKKMESVGFRGSCLPNRAHKGGVVTHQYIIEITLPTPMLMYPFRFFLFF